MREIFFLLINWCLYIDSECESPKNGLMRHSRISFDIKSKNIVKYFFSLLIKNKNTSLYFKEVLSLKDIKREKTWSREWISEKGLYEKC